MKITIGVLLFMASSLVLADTLPSAANTGVITGNNIYLPVLNSNGTATAAKIENLNNLPVGEFKKMGVASTVHTRVIGGTAMGGSDDLDSTDLIIYTSDKAGFFNYTMPAPKWMSNIIVGACNNPVAATDSDGKTIYECPSDESGYAITDTAHFFHFFCGASLINESFVLTAAHCLRDLKDSNNIPLTIAFISVQVDNTKYTTDHKGRKIYYSGSGMIETNQAYRDYADLYVVHPKYQTGKVGKGYDLALVRLKNPLYPGSRDIPVTPVNIAKSATYSTSYKENESMRVYGWGMTSATATSLSATLIEGVVPYTGSIYFTHTLTAGNKNNDTCSGDSGGPLMANGLQIGVTSFGLSTCGASGMGVYTDVGAFYNWIRTTISENAKSPSTCFADTDCYVNGILVKTGTNTTTDPVDTADPTLAANTSTSTSTNTTDSSVTTSSSSSSGGGAIDPMVLLLIMAGFIFRAKHQKGKS